MTTNTVDAIYTRHERALMTVGHASDIVRFCLRLALEELAASTPSMPSTNGHDQSQAERDRDALAAEIHDLRSQLAQLDADNAALIRRNKDLADDLRRSQERPAPTNGNGAAANPPYVLPDNLPLWAQPQALDGLDPEATDWWIGGAVAGRHTWRTVPKAVQLRMVRHILSFGPESGAMKMVDFDAIKPDWMPTSARHTKTLGLSWPQLNDWTVEL